MSPFITVTSTPDGKFSADFPIGNEWVHKIQVMQGGNEDTAVRFPFTITGSAVSQNASVTLAPGALAMTQAGDGLDFGTVTLNGEAQTVKANLNQVTVTDARGGTLGWSLTGSMTDLVAANGTDKIPAGNLAWTPSCAATEGSLSAVANGTAGPLSSSAATLCGVTADGTTSGGKFTADAEVSLTTPKFGAAGSYTGTLTLTLI
ncbi:WxL domain-containing protein [Yinghuangia aomiensis]